MKFTNQITYSQLLLNQILKLSGKLKKWIGQTVVINTS